MADLGMSPRPFFDSLHHTPLVSLNEPRTFSEIKMFYVLVHEVCGFVEYELPEPSALISIQCGDSVVSATKLNSTRLHNCCINQSI